MSKIKEVVGSGNAKNSLSNYSFLINIKGCQITKKILELIAQKLASKNVSFSQNPLFEFRSYNF